MNKFVNLNYCKKAIQSILWNNWGVKIPLKDIKVSYSKHMTYISGQKFLYFDRHLHYENRKDWTLAEYLYLKQIDELSQIVKDSGLYLKFFK